MRDDGLLVVGASQAGVQLAASLRDFGHEGTVQLVGAEPLPPYQRPPLSKAYLAGATTAATLALRSPEFLQQRAIDLVVGERVVELDLDAGHGRTDVGRELRFARVALTTGARPRRLAVPGAELPEVHYLRDVRDADALKDALPRAQRVVVVGGGFVGLEAASVATTYGKQVVVVEFADRLIGRAVSKQVSEFYRAAHERRGVCIRTGTGVRAITGTGRVEAVVCDDGTTIPADLVLVGVGAVPRTELAELLGLELDGGVVVDAAAQTSDPRVVAAGDCTVQPHPITGEGRVRLESVQNAVDQAKVAAATLTGTAVPAGSVPWFWSDQGDLKLQIAGLSAGSDEQVVRGDPGKEKFSVLHFRAGLLTAVDCVNRPSDYLLVRQALKRGATLTPDAARDQRVELKALLAR